MDNLNISCVHPCKNYNYESTNDYSAVYLISMRDFSMLMMGDAESKAEKCIIQDVKKSGGGLVKPETALISCGIDNSYGHPHKETLQRFTDAGTKVYRTDECGEIMVRVWNGSYETEVFKERKK